MVNFLPVRHWNGDSGIWKWNWNGVEPPSEKFGLLSHAGGWVARGEPLRLLLQLGRRRPLVRQAVPVASSGAAIVATALQHYKEKVEPPALCGATVQSYHLYTISAAPVKRNPSNGSPRQRPVAR